MKGRLTLALFSLCLLMLALCGQARSFLIDLSVADVGQAWPGWPAYTLRQIAHMAVGVFAAFLPTQWAVAGAMLWLWKEISFDLPGGRFGLIHWADTLADLFAAAAGMALTNAHNRRTRHLPIAKWDFHND